jgi:hypothetical protein
MNIIPVLVVATIAFALLIADRVMRISPFMEREGFASGSGPQRCGVDLAPCPHPLRCMNGFCFKEEQAQLFDRNPLPVLP